MASQGDKEDKTHLSKLPKNVDWSSFSESALYQYQGFWYPGVFIEGVLNAQELRFSPSDILLCSSPKSGLTWLKALAFSVVTRTRFDLTSRDHPLCTSFLHDLIPYIETNNPRDPELPLLSTHINYTSLPKSISAEGGCKIVYICRNPKDVFVSLWHFVQKLGPPEHCAIPLDKAFELFCRGISQNGPYLDHVMEYWKASLEHPERILFLKYEDMMEDVEPHVRRLARFMGCPFSEEEDREGVPAKIVDMCSFGSLSQLEVNKAKEFHVVGKPMVSNSIFFRKAKVEDWNLSVITCVGSFDRVVYY